MVELEQAMAEGSSNPFLRMRPGSSDGNGWPFANFAIMPALRRLWAAFRSAGFDPDDRLDYVSWQERLGRYPDDPEVISTMSRDDLKMLIVRFSRGERFCDGYLDGLVINGSFLAAARRICAIEGAGQTP